jgi:hypothetical protein
VPAFRYLSKGKERINIKTKIAAAIATSTLGLVTASALLLTPSAAIAAGGNQVGHHPAVTAARGAHSVAVPASSFKPVPTAGPSKHLALAGTGYGGSCPIRNPGGVAGAFICGTKILKVHWTDGHDEWFVVGTDNAVYHSFSDKNTGAWGPWFSFGGWASQGVFSLSANTFAVVGVANNLYCQTADPTAPSGWSGFYLCGDS